jgi:PPOX class probable F420-dependent enzyme
MPNRRAEIRFTDDEVRRFLETERVLNVATFNHDETIHLVAMWFALVDDVPWFHTYPKSQKIQNLRRDPRMTGLVEAGDAYEELRGVELVGTGIVVDDPEAVRALGRVEAVKYFGADEDGAEAIAEGMVQKRVAVRFDIDRVVSWDHRKMAP